MRKGLFRVIAAFMLLSGTAWAQATLRPDSTPRLPPQPGQGLPQEDKEFLRRATMLNAAELAAAQLGMDRASDPELKAQSREAHDVAARLQEQLQRAAKRDGAAPPAGSAAGQWKTELTRLQGLSGREFDTALLRWQLQAHKAMTGLFQDQASATPEPDLAKLAINALNDIKPQFERLRALGERYGVTVEMVGQPWQY